MSRNPMHNNRFGAVGRFFSSAADSVSFAREAMAITNTPESVFRARGTSRQDALRDLVTRF